jgi:four helix bundle protein
MVALDAVAFRLGLRGSLEIMESMSPERKLPTETFTFEELACWQEARRLRLLVARDIVKRLPFDERHRLVDQLLRAARSATANIAEGYGRYHFRDNCRFCALARASCFEVLDHLITAADEGLLSEALLAEGREAVCATVKVLNGYMAYLKRQARE